MWHCTMIYGLTFFAFFTTFWVSLESQLVGKWQNVKYAKNVRKLIPIFILVNLVHMKFCTINIPDKNAKLS